MYSIDFKKKSYFFKPAARTLLQGGSDVCVSKLSCCVNALKTTWNEKLNGLKRNEKLVKTNNVCSASTVQMILFSM